MQTKNTTLHDDFNVIDELNVIYGFVNMDINSLVDKTKFDRKGLTFLSDKMY